MAIMRQHMLVLLALWLGQFGSAELEAGGDSFVQEASQLMHVQKCCPQAQMMVEVASANGPKFLCQVQNDSFNWAPDYLDTQDILHSFGNKTDAKNTTLLHSQLSQESHLCAADNGPCLLPITGKPQCGPGRAWPVFTYAGFQEDLQLRPYGILRHVVDKFANAARHYEYELDQYCVDGIKLLATGSHFSHSGPDLDESDPDSIYYALICEPVGPWDRVDFFNVFVRVLYPIGLGLGLVVLVGLVSLHFILKELRDLSGCMLISLIVSLIVSMLANLILVTTDSQSDSHIDLLYIESLAHGSDIAVHFWLNAIGHRAWTAVRHPRKEALRPEGKRYLFYSFYTWGSSVCVVSLALVVHFFIDVKAGKPITSSHTFFTWYKIGWLALSLFFSTSVFLMLGNIYFYFNSRSSISKQTAYGRTFHRSKGFFQAFTRFVLIIDVIWLIQTLSWLQYSFLVVLRVMADLLLPFLILWAALKGRRVMHLLKIRLQMSQCWICRRCFPAKNREHHSLYYGEEMMALGTPI